MDHFTGREIGQNGEPLFPNLNPTTAKKPYTYLARPRSTPPSPETPRADGAVARCFQPVRIPTSAGTPTRSDTPPTSSRSAPRSNTSQNTPTQYPHVHPEEFAKALLAHKLGGTVSATYRDLNREALSVAIVPYMWRCSTTTAPSSAAQTQPA